MIIHLGPVSTIAGGAFYAPVGAYPRRQVLTARSASLAVMSGTDRMVGLADVVQALLPCLGAIQ